MTLAISRYAWLSILAAAITIVLKFGAYLVTGSVGLLSDALESLVNLAGAGMTLAMLTIAGRPADKEHAYGHAKAEYFSSGFEGGLILLAAASIIVAAVPRLLNPQPLEQTGIGLAIAIAASIVNLGIAQILRHAGKRHNSIALEADSQHLMTDVWTSVGVVIGVAATTLTGWHWLDPAVAILVAANIVWTAIQILRRTTQGLMDIALPAQDQDKLREIFQSYEAQGLQFHALRSRQAGAQAFVDVHMLTPGEWTVGRAHEVAEQLEAEVSRVLPNTMLLTHLEPVGEAISYAHPGVELLEPADALTSHHEG